jgi:prepilin-type N-terminal cleavage/methylation domain-containing protein
MQIPHFIRRRLALPREGQTSERGDTLIEVLVAIAVISIAVVALLGSLLTSASASVTHRNVTNLDGILRSFAESARYQIQTQPADGSVGPQFRPCGVGSAPPQYNLASDPYPNSAKAGGWITVFVTGYLPNQALSVTVGGSSTGITIESGGTTDSNGNATLVFTAPNGSGAVKVTDAVGDQATPKVPFTVTSSGTAIAASQYANYKLTSTVTQYPSSGGGTCPLTPGQPAPTQQQILLTLSDPQSGNGAADQLPFVIGNFGPAPVTVAVSYSNPAQTVPSTLTFVAGATNAAGTPLTTGTVTWNFSSGTPGNPTCPTSTLPATPTCAINVTNYASAGNYSVTATYHALPASGSPYPDGYSGQTTAVLGKAQPTIAVTQTASAGPLVFSASVSGGGPVPSGTMTWTLSGSDGSNWTCPSQPGVLNGSNLVFTCTSNLTSPATGVTYTASANYVQDPNNPVYSNGLGQLSIVTPLTTVVGTAGSNDRVTFTATVANSRTDNATVTNGSSVVTDAAITATDTGNPVVGTGIPAGSYVGTVTPGVSFLLSSNPTSQANVAANNSGTSVTVSEPGAGSTPSGTVKWTIATAAPGTPVTCADSTLSSGMATCTFGGVATAVYTATAQYQGDSTNYIYASGISNGVPAP